MSEREILSEISRIARNARKTADAAQEIEARLAVEIGGAMIRLRLQNEGVNAFLDGPTSRFMESREFPFRGLYVAPLAIRGREAGTLIACFGSWGARGEFLERATAHIGEQLADLLARTQSRGSMKGEDAKCAG